ncbi:phosphomannomutase/phosphoglucomutase [Candidatus Woesebacteria bacterium]|nr:MAG: phosphomannomutase/phosphoglucomutase [Candidatus Woesebacteria bacterium]
MKIDASIFKAYDIRGIYPDQLNEDLFYGLGHAYVSVVNPQGEVMVGHDVRVYSEPLKKSLIEGLTDAGVNVVDVGLISTDMYYFGVGNFDFAGGIQVTASHNPPEWHGAKMVREKVIPLTLETGVSQIRDFIEKGVFEKKQKGSVRKIDIVDDYCKFVLNWVDIKKIKPMKIVYNPNFGFAGKVFERLIELGNLPLTIIPLNAEPDGTFPKGRPDPFMPENRVEFIELVKSEDADLGITWDADADRVFFCADGGVFLEPYYMNAILIEAILKKHPSEKIIYDPRYTWALIDSIKTNGGTPVLERVGHSYIKQRMRKEDAYFGGESSGHEYYRDFWYADSGMLPVVQVLEYVSEHSKKLSEIARVWINKYVISGEINTKVTDVDMVMELIKAKYGDGKQEFVDGISVEYGDYRFNVRSSNTEPLLRLNLEARTKDVMEKKRDEVLSLITQYAIKE